jgi:tellurite resistance protein TerC
LTHQFWLWIGFAALVAAALYVDLFLASRHHHAVGMKEAGIWYGVWMSLAVLFGAGVIVFLSAEKGLQFFTGYLLEQSLSVDNMFVFILIFSYFRIEPRRQPRILKWGILGAVLMRFMFIFAGAALLERFHWMIYVFGAFLVYTAYGMAFGGKKEFDPKSHPVFSRLMRVLPLGDFDGDRFFSRAAGAWAATPLFLTLIIVELSDVVFATDSIPAIFAVTTDRFIVYTSNIFAILGLRALYFLLAGLVQAFAYLKYGVAVILAFVGGKMLLTRVVRIPTLGSMAVVVIVLAASVALSLAFPPRQQPRDFL